MALDIFVVLIYAAGMLLLGWYGMRKAKTHESLPALRHHRQHLVARRQPALRNALRIARRCPSLTAKARTAIRQEP